MRKQRRGFQLKFKGRDAFSIKLARSGMSYAPALEHGLVARWWGFHRVQDFLDLEGDEQAELIAVYRAHHQIEAVLTDYHMKHPPKK